MLLPLRMADASAPATPGEEPEQGAAGGGSSPAAAAAPDGAGEPEPEPEPGGTSAASSSEPEAEEGAEADEEHDDAAASLARARKKLAPDEYVEAGEEFLGSVAEHIGQLGKSLKTLIDSRELLAENVVDFVKLEKNPTCEKALAVRPGSLPRCARCALPVLLGRRRDISTIRWLPCRSWRRSCKR